MLKTVFTVKLNEKIVPKKVSIGKFDGNNPCIVAATSSDKVLNDYYNALRKPDTH